jgi:hypothetical protein
MSRRYRRRYSSYDYDDDDWDQYRREREEYEDNCYECEQEEYYRSYDDDVEYRDQDEELPASVEDEVNTAFMCSDCDAAPDLDTAHSTTQTTQTTLTTTQFIASLVNMVSLSSAKVTKLSYIDKLFNYLRTVPAFLETNVRFKEVSIAKAKEFRNNLDAQSIYQTLDAYIEKYSS